MSHFMIAGFSSLEEMDKYFHKLYKIHNDLIKIRKINVFPADKMIKCSSKDFFFGLLKDYGKEKEHQVLQIYPEEATIKKRNKVKLTQNEKTVLVQLATNGRMSYKEIASNSKENNLTSKGVSKIKERLERRGIIKGYSCTLNKRKFGVNILAAIFLKKKPQYSNLENDFQKWADQSRNVLGCYHLNEESLHVLLCAFKNIKELESYSQEMHKINSSFFEVEQIHIIPQEGILKDSKKDLVVSILQNQESNKD